jgi:beta-glucanase (GH16 family)
MPRINLKIVTFALCSRSSYMNLAKKILFIGNLLACFIVLSCITPRKSEAYKLVWSDEFNGPAIDTASWSFATGTGGNGWGNHELEYYTPRKENAEIKNGQLVITARKEDYNGYAYTSARMLTKGKRDFVYGRVDIRAKLPEGQGIWPALWMLGANIDSVGWPACGEIDIMEMIGHKPDTVFGTLHWGRENHRSKGGNFGLAAGKFKDDFHIFSLLWETDSIGIMVDDHKFFSISRQEFSNGEYPFDKPQYFLFNVAVGGDWPGSPDVSTVFPQQMIVDYIRVFQKK